MFYKITSNLDQYIMDSDSILASNQNVPEDLKIN